MDNGDYGQSFAYEVDWSFIQMWYKISMDWEIVWAIFSLYKLW